MTHSPVHAIVTAALRPKTAAVSDGSADHGDFAGALAMVQGNLGKDSTAKQAAAGPVFAGGHVLSEVLAGSPSMKPTPIQGPGKIVRVTNGASLTNALAQAQADQRIVLRSGVYSSPTGSFQVRAPGVTIEAESPLGARLRSDLKLLGPDQTASGLTLDGASAEINGDRSRLTFSRIANADGIAVLVSGGVDTRVDHNELVGLKGRGISIKPNLKEPSDLLRPKIDHNWIHSFSGSRTDGDAHEAIQLGQTLTHTDVPLGAVVEANLIEDVDQVHSVISVKSSGNVIRGNTLLDCSGGLVMRHGERNLIEANWVERSRGIWIRDQDNTVAGNRVLNSGGIGLRVLAGNVGPDSKEKGYPYASGTRLIGNQVDRLVIGDNSTAPSNRLPAVGTRIEGSQGAEPEIGLAKSTIRVPKGGRGTPTAVRLTRADVGIGTAVS